jgi:hypothetical protein
MTKANLDAYIYCMKKETNFCENQEWPFDNSNIEKRINVLEDIIKKELSVLHNLSHY